MKRIWQKQKLILILAVAVLLSVIFIRKSIPVAYAQWNTVGGVIYSPEGYFLADNSVFGGPGIGGDGIHSEPGCGNCLGGYWESYSCNCTEDGCSTCYRWICTLKRDGIMGTFTEDSACKAAYGQSVSVKNLFGPNINLNICDFSTSKAHRIECVVSNLPPPVLPPPLGSSCTWWQGGNSNSGICEKVVTGLSGAISTEPAQFIVRILTIILSFAGGIALLLIISAGYKIMTSKGKPEGIQQGRDQLFAAIIGLVFIIFSFVIFQFVVVDILKIPGIT